MPIHASACESVGSIACIASGCTCRNTRQRPIPSTGISPATTRWRASAELRTRPLRQAMLLPLQRLSMPSPFPATRSTAARAPVPTRTGSADSSPTSTTIASRRNTSPCLIVARAVARSGTTRVCSGSRSRSTSAPVLSSASISTRRSSSNARTAWPTWLYAIKADGLDYVAPNRDDDDDESDDD